MSKHKRNSINKKINAIDRKTEIFNLLSSIFGWAELVSFPFLGIWFANKNFLYLIIGIVIWGITFGASRFFAHLSKKSKQEKHDFKQANIVHKPKKKK